MSSQTISYGSGYGSGDGSGDGYGYGSGDGYGYGSGYGSGDGSGDGYGDGYGYGDGSGDGSGDGYGYGYGSGDGYGYGSGDGYGDGSGDGSGDGYGYGDGYGDGSGEEYWSEIAISLAPREHAERIKSAGAVIAFWKSDAKGRPANGGSGDAVAAGTIQEVSGPLELCGRHALHGTLNPMKWKGERLWVAAFYPPIEKDDDKIGSLKREILAEVDASFLK